MKKALKFFFILNLILVIALSIFTYFIYKDAMALKGNLAQSSNIVLLEENNKALTGIILRELSQVVSQKNLEQYSVYLANDDYSKILGSYYKFILVDMEAVLNIDQDSFTIQEQEFTKDELLVLLRSGENLEYRAAAFSYVFSKYLFSQNNLLKEYKKGNIFIYPETIMFKVIKIIPVSLFDKALQKAS
tara:strand:+ start:90 stop:656 length:567 start_codon:yes stop_codon:yes gene_type:complete